MGIDPLMIDFHMTLPCENILCVSLSFDRFSQILIGLTQPII